MKLPLPLGTPVSSSQEHAGIAWGLLAGMFFWRSTVISCDKDPVCTPNHSKVYTGTTVVFRTPSPHRPHILICECSPNLKSYKPKPLPHPRLTALALLVMSETYLELGSENKDSLPRIDYQGLGLSWSHPATSSGPTPLIISQDGTRI